MPQLDKVTFLSQFFWLCVFFLSFYVISLKYFLPKIGRVLKYRKKRLNESGEGVNAVQEENDKVQHSTNRLLESGLKSSREVFNSNLQKTENWLTEYTNHANKSQLKETNYTYLHSLGKRSLSNNLSLQGSFSDFSSAVFVAVLIGKLKSPITKRSPTSKQASLAGTLKRAQANLSKTKKN